MKKRKEKYKVGFFLEFVICICAAAVADVLIMQTIPDNTMKKSVQLVCAIVFCAFIVFKISNAENISFLKEDNFYENSVYSDGVRKTFSHSLEKNIESSVKNAFPNAQIKVNIVAGMNEKYEIEVISVMADLSGADKYAVKKFIETEYKIPENKIIF